MSLILDMLESTGIVMGKARCSRSVGYFDSEYEDPARCCCAFVCLIIGCILEQIQCNIEMSDKRRIGRLKVDIENNKNGECIWHRVCVQIISV